MNQFDKSIKIRIILDNIESICDGLRVYRDLLVTDKAVENQVFQVEFVQEVNGQYVALQASDGDVALTSKLPDGDGTVIHNDEIALESISSEGILFAHALKYEALKEDLLKTAEEIVAYSRRHNDTWTLWLDDMGVFGIEALLVLALKHPEYAYLLGGYLIPYWDDEHADYALYYPATLLSDETLSDETLKMFCYCDNASARRIMLGGDVWGEEEFTHNYVTFFEEKPKRYERFKELLRERFKEQAYIEYTEDDYTAYPVYEFYKSVAETAYEESDDETTPFMGSTFYEEAMTLQNEIEEALGRPLTTPPLSDEDKEDEWDHMRAPWENFFKEGFGFGDQIWSYIIEGKNPEVLGQIKAFNIMTYTKEQELDLYKFLAYYTSECEPFEEAIHHNFAEFLHDYYEEEASGMVVMFNGVDASGRDIILRALDVIQRILGQPLPGDLYELIIETKVIAMTDFYHRYDALMAEKHQVFEILWKELDGYYFNRQGTKVMRLYTVLKNNRQALTQEKWRQEPPTYSRIAFSFFALDQDQKASVTDDLTSFMEIYIETHWLTALLSAIKESSSLEHKDIQLIEDYIEGQAIEQETVVECIKTGLHAEEDVDEGHRHYNVLDDMDESLAVLLPSLYYGARRRPYQSTQKIVRTLKLFLKLAPVKLLKMTHVFLDRQFDAIMEETDALYDLKQDYRLLGALPEHFLALDILVGEEAVIDGLLEDYREDNSGGGLFSGPSRKDIEKALSYIRTYQYDDFMDRL